MIDIKCENCKFWSQKGHTAQGEDIDMTLKMGMAGVCAKMSNPEDSIGFAIRAHRGRFVDNFVLKGYSKNVYSTRYNFGCNRFEKDEFEQEKCQKPANFKETELK